MSALLSATAFVASARAAQVELWKQPAVRTGIERVEALAWAPTLEVALERAAKENKLVLASVVAVGDDHWVGGYAGASELYESRGEPAFGAEVSMANDDGLRKERVMMAVWFAQPDVAALIEKHFVPVRVRCRPWDFDLEFKSDPLTPLGVTLDEVGAPALVVSKPDGKCVHALRRIGVFAPAIAPAMLRASLAKAGVSDVAPAPEAAPQVDSEAAAFAAASGLRLDEWTRGAKLDLAPLAPTTEVGAGRRSDEAVLDRAASVLLALQSSSGGWGNPALDIRPIGGAGTEYDYEVPRTALVVDALLALRERLPARRAEFERAASSGIALVGRFADEPKAWIWHATYALHLQLVLLRTGAEDESETTRKRAARLVECLIAMQQDGGWSYMPSPRTHSFNTALVLLLLCEARELGVAVPEDAVAKARRFLESVRNPNEPRDYWYAPAMTFEPRASSCRSALCELALVASGDSSANSRLAAAVSYFFELEPAAREVTKIYESFLSPKSLQDAYHYYFGHYYAARALSHLPRSRASSLARTQLEILRRQVEADGSFVDAQAQGKSYSTAMAVLTLLEDLRFVRR